MSANNKKKWRRTSVGDKLFFTYVFLAFLGVILAVVAWLGLSSIDRSHHKVVHESTPMMLEFYRLSESVVHLVNLASSQSQIEGIDQLNELGEEIERISAQIEYKVNRLQIFESKQGLVKKVDGLLKQLQQHIRLQNDLVRQGIINRNKFQQEHQAARQAIAGISLQLKPTLTKLELSQSEKNQNLQQTIERLEQEITEVEKVLNQIPFVNSSERLLNLETSYTLLLRRITSQLVGLQNRELRKRLVPHISVLLEQLDAEEAGIFSMLLNEIDLAEEVEQSKQASRMLSSDLTNVVSSLVAQGETTIQTDYAAADRDRRNAQYLLLALVGCFILIPLVIFVLYLKPKVIQRLNRLVENTRNIAQGNLNIEIDTSGKDELSDMAQALDQFQYDLKVKRNSEIELRKTLVQLEVQKQALDQFAIVAETDAKGSIIQANSKFCDVSGYSKEELLGKNHSEVVNSGYHTQAFWKSMWGAIKNNRVWRGDVCNRTKTGDIYWVDSTIVPICDQGTEPTRFLAIRFLITDRKRAEEELKASEERFRLVGELATDGYWDWDLKTNDEYMSPSFKRLFGYEDHEIPNRAEGWQKIMHPEDFKKAVAAFEQHTQEGLPFNVPVRYCHKNGHLVWVICRGVALRDEEGEFYRMIGTHTDITELKRVEEELAESNRELEQFAFIASHDLQEPLRTITGYVQLIEKRYADQFDQDGMEFMAFVVDGAKRMKALISDLLVYSRAGRIERNLEVFALKDLVGEITSLLEAQINEKKAEIVVPDGLPKLEADMGQIRQLMQNLISNALKFARENVPPKIEIHYQIEKSEDGRAYHRIAVQDNGIGINNRYFEKMFLIFQRLNARDRYPGTGIGLAICKKIVERHQGRIWARSEPGQGTTFYFTLPCEKAAANLGS